MIVGEKECEARLCELMIRFSNFHICKLGLNYSAVAVFLLWEGKQKVTITYRGSDLVLQKLQSEFTQPWGFASQLYESLPERHQRIDWTFGVQER